MFIIQIVGYLKKARTVIILSIVVSSILTPMKVFAQNRFNSVETVELSDDLVTWGTLGGVAVDGLGYVYVSNFSSDVWRIAKDGKVKLLTDSIYSASGNAIDANGDLLQASHYNNSLYKISRTGKITTIVEGKLNAPVGVAVDNRGNIFVTNCYSNDIVKIDVEKKLSIISKHPAYNCPNGLAFDNKGNLYVVNFDNTIIIKIDSDGNSSKFTTLPGIGNSHLAFFKGYLYATQIFEHRVFRIDSYGNYEVFLGDGTTGNSDGKGTQAQVAWPNGIAVSNDGKLYVNTLDGNFRNYHEAAKLQLRVVQLPTLRSSLLEAFARGGEAALRPTYENYKAKYMSNAKDVKLVAGLVATVDRMIDWSKLDLALAIGRLGLSLYPESWEIMVAVGDVHGALKKPKLAKTFFDSALKLKPGEVHMLSRIEELLIP